MKVILDIKEKSRVAFFMELIKGLNYVDVITEIKEKRKSKAISDLSEAFEDVKQFEAGKKKLKTGKQLLNEL